MLVLAVLLSVSVVGGVDAGVSEIIEDTVAYIMKTVTVPGIGQTGGDWAIFALMRSGSAIAESYVRSYYNKAAGHIDDVGGVLSTVRYSDYSRVAIAMSSIGAEPRDIGGFDLLEPLNNYDATVFQGINGPIFAIIALSGAGYGEEPIIGRYIEYMLSRQLNDGGFALSGTVSDPDTTAMALTALSFCRSHTGVGDAIDSALSRLSRLQMTTGGFSSYNSTNSESVSQVIIALCSLGISLEDERFVKDGHSLLDSLLTYYIKGQGFEHERGSGSSMMATEQALCALAALLRIQAGRNSLYDMSDAPKLPLEMPQDRPDGMHPDVNIPVVSASGISFSDLTGHENENAVLRLAERGIVNGFPDGVFRSELTVSRAQFAAIIVRALGLKAGDMDIRFADVPDGSWFFDYTRPASAYGIIKGRSADVFDPEGFITRQEAAIMVFRAAALCGITEALDDTAIRNILSQFVDYRSVDSWATEEMAFCYFTGIVDDSDIEIKPTERINRGEAAEMVYRMLLNTRSMGDTYDKA